MKMNTVKRPQAEAITQAPVLPAPTQADSPTIGAVGKKGEATRQQILTASLTLFRERGFDAATMRDISECAGMSLRPSYYYFPSKHAILSSYYPYFHNDHRHRVNHEI